MENTMYFGGMLMLIGMTTVFIILALVVLGGKVTILATNKFAPQKIVQTGNTFEPVGNDGKKVAAITAAVNTITQGKGRIVEIKRMNK